MSRTARGDVHGGLLTSLAWLASCLMRTLQSWLGFAIMLLLVLYHFVTCDTKFEHNTQQQ